MADENLGRRETPEVKTRTVLLLTAGILVFLVVIAFGVGALFPGRIGRAGVTQHQQPLPGVIPNERSVRLSLEAKQRQDLNGGRGRIPVEEAMQAIAAKGPHAFDPIGAPK